MSSELDEMLQAAPKPTLTLDPFPEMEENAPAQPGAQAAANAAFIYRRVHRVSPILKKICPVPEERGGKASVPHFLIFSPAKHPRVLRRNSETAPGPPAPAVRKKSLISLKMP